MTDTPLMPRVLDLLRQIMHDAKQFDEDRKTQPIRITTMQKIYPIADEIKMSLLEPRVPSEEKTKEAVKILDWLVCDCGDDSHKKALAHLKALSLPGVPDEDEGV